MLQELIKIWFVYPNVPEDMEQMVRHKARPKESLKAISTGTSATESWKHT